MRYKAYGSALDNDKNSQYFADFYGQVSPNNTSTPSISNYLRTHSIHDYCRKFIYHGLFRIPNQFYSLLGEVWMLLLFFGTVNYLILDRFSQFDVLFILFFVFVAGLTPVFEVYGIPRHLYVLLPFTFIISSKLLINLLRGSIRNNILVLLFILLLLVGIPLKLNLSTANVTNITTAKVHDK
jgi:hypothetical protein